MSDTSRRGRRRPTILSVTLLILVSATHDGGVLAGLMSTLSVLSEVLDELAQFIRALTAS